jgi:pilus assembly protein Flp/PilA
MVNYVFNFVNRLRNDERGLTAVEYAVLGGIIVAGLVALGTTFDDGLKAAFTGLFDQVSTAQGG